MGPTRSVWKRLTDYILKDPDHLQLHNRTATALLNSQTTGLGKREDGERRKRNKRSKPSLTLMQDLITASKAWLHSTDEQLVKTKAQRNPPRSPPYDERPPGGPILRIDGGGPPPRGGGGGPYLPYFLSISLNLFRTNFHPTYCFPA